jgi:hypothetical protein
MLTCPVADPATEGLNVSVTVMVCPGLRLAGRLTGDAEKPLPVTVIDLTVTGAVPVDRQGGRPSIQLQRNRS